MSEREKDVQCTETRACSSKDRVQERTCEIEKVSERASERVCECVCERESGTVHAHVSVQHRSTEVPMVPR